MRHGDDVMFWIAVKVIGATILLFGVALWLVDKLFNLSLKHFDDY